jgi:hypothetical protein
LAYNFRGSSTWSVGPLVLGLWWGRTVWQECVMEQKEKERGTRVPPSLWRHVPSDWTTSIRLHLLKVLSLPKASVGDQDFWDTFKTQSIEVSEKKQAKLVYKVILGWYGGWHLETQLLVRWQIGWSWFEVRLWKKMTAFLKVQARVVAHISHPRYWEAQAGGLQPQSKMWDSARCWWLMPIILATQEAEIRRIMIWSQHRWTLCEILSQKTHLIKGLVEWLKM